MYKSAFFIPSWVSFYMISPWEFCCTAQPCILNCEELCKLNGSNMIIYCYTYGRQIISLISDMRITPFFYVQFHPVFLVICFFFLGMLEEDSLNTHLQADYTNIFYRNMGAKPAFSNVQALLWVGNIISLTKISVTLLLNKLIKYTMSF